MISASDTFKRAWLFALRWENANVENDPDDAGGRTKFGVDQASHPHVNIAALTADQAGQIYHDDEWVRCRCDDLPRALAIAVFDLAMTSGKGTAIMALQRAVGVTPDGFIGPKTIGAVSSAWNKSGELTLAGFFEEEDTHFRHAAETGRNNKYLRGWLNRLSDMKSYLHGSSTWSKEKERTPTKGGGAVVATVALLILAGLGLSGCADMQRSAYYPSELRWRIDQSYSEETRHAKDTSTGIELRWPLKPVPVREVSRPIPPAASTAPSVTP